MSIEKHGSRWRVSYTLDGSRVRKVFDSRSKAESFDREVRTKSRRSKQSSKGSVEMTVAEMIEGWWEWRHSSGRPMASATAACYESVIRLHIGPLIGSADAAQMRPYELQDFFDTFANRKSPRTAQICQTVLKQAWDWAILRDRIQREGNPATIASPALHYIQPKRDRDLPTLEQVVGWIRECKDPDMKLYLNLAVMTGARVSEICALKISDFDFDRGIVHIQRAVDTLAKTTKEPKRPWSIRSLPVGVDALAALRELLPTHYEHDEPNDWVLRFQTSEFGWRNWNRYHVQNEWYNHLPYEDTKKYSPKDLRHFVATRLLVSGQPPGQVARWLGHRNDNMVRVLYGNHIQADALTSIGEVTATLRG